MVGNSNESPTLPAKSRLYAFQFGPFRFESDIDIPELHGRTGSGHIAVTIVLAQTPHDIHNASRYGRFCQVAPTEYLLTIAKVGSFHVLNGNTVRVQLAPGAPGPDISTFLLGSVFGALCHQNGLLPLHASAVEVQGAVTAFLGDSGAGKSTLAACLQGRGHRIVSDDICVLEGEAEMRVIPVAGWLKLWRASLTHLGETPDERNRVYSEDDKYRLYLESDPAARPRLANLIFLERAGSPDAEPAAQPRLEPLPTAETIGRMMRFTYLGYITELTGSHPRVFRQCARTLEHARGYRLVVPWGFDHMDAVLDLLAATVLSTS